MLVPYLQDKTPYIQQLVLHASLDNIEDMQWTPANFSGYMKVLLSCRPAVHRRVQGSCNANPDIATFESVLLLQYNV